LTAETLGEYLRQEREKRGITLEQVASATKINIRILQLLESDHYPDLPAKPFVRGFVMSYAKFVGLDVQEILTRFSDYLEEKAKERPNRETGHMGYAFEKRESEQNHTYLWSAMISFAVVGALGLLIFKPKLGHKHHSHVDDLREAQASPSPDASPLGAAVVVSSSASPSTNPVSASPQPQNSASPSPTASATPKPTAVPKATATPKPSSTPKPSATPKPSVTPKPKPSATPASVQANPAAKPAENPADPLNKGDELKPNDVKQKVVLKAIDDIQVRYTIDDKPVTSFILRKDSFLMMKARTSIVVQVSDPERVYLKYRTNDFTPLTQVKDLSIFNEMSTLIKPSQLVEKIKDPFHGARKLNNPPPKK